MSDARQSGGRSRAARLAEWVVIGAGVVALVAILVSSLAKDQARRGGAPPTLAPFTPKPFHVSGDSPRLELLGVVPGGSDKLYDPAGKLVGPCEVGGSAVWGKDTFKYAFLLRAPEAGFPGAHVSCQITPSDPGVRRFDIITSFFDEADLKTSSTFTYTGHIRRRDMPPGQPFPVNLAVRYYAGPPQPAMIRLPGPLAYEQVFTPQPGTEVRVGPMPRDEDGKLLPRSGMRFTLRVDRVLDAVPPLIVYDHQGERHFFSSMGRSGSVQGGHADYSVTYSGEFDLIQPEEIAFVTIGERPRETVFHNVTLSYPEHPEWDHMPYLDELARRLGLPPSTNPAELENLQIKSRREFLAAVDLVRGHQLRRVSEYLLHNSILRPQSLTPAEQEKIRAAARRAIRMPDVDSHAHGLCIGLWGGWPEFIPPAFDAIRRDNKFSISITEALRNHAAGSLADEQFREIGRILEARRRPDQLRHRVYELIYMLQDQSGRPAALAELRRLAESDESWLWMAALNANSAIEKLLTLEPPSEKIRLRVSALDKLIPSTMRQRQAVPNAHAILADLLTPRLFFMNASGCAQAAWLIAQHYPRDEASAAFIRFFKALRAEPRPWNLDYHDFESGITLAFMVRHLNAWHGVNFGGLGADVNLHARYDDSKRRGFLWPTLVDEIVQWAESRPIAKP